MKSRIVLAIATLSLLAACSSGDESDAVDSTNNKVVPNPTNTSVHVLGKVESDTGIAIPGCNIEDEGRTEENAIITGDDGTFELYKSPGSYNIKVICDSERYEETEIEADIPDTAETEITITVNYK